MVCPALISLFYYKERKEKAKGAKNWNRNVCPLRPLLFKKLPYVTISFKSSNHYINKQI